MSMAWAMGSASPGAPPSGPWPNFTKACKNQDWEGAAKECKMKNAVGTQVRRNDRNVILFRNAGRGSRKAKGMRTCCNGLRISMHERVLASLSNYPRTAVMVMGGPKPARS